jgi:RNA polymerase sigma factor (TIGR02999 family)
VQDVTGILNALAQGDSHAASQLLPLVYDELRRLAAQKLSHEKPGQTLEPTALVHEAYLRLVATPPREGGAEAPWAGRGHFFAAAAEAMRRILVESARRKKRAKHGGDHQRVDLEDIAAPGLPDDILALDEALDRLAGQEPAAVQVVQLHFFAGLSIEEAAQVLAISRATAYRHWAYARAWLRCAISGEDVLPAE